ncbi:MAG: hypothetical protein CMN30_11295 [Sandaracinus sp.]|nr:hypothetical protein [Sandaracinus sp.]MAR57355.1 hypothetical protein [Rickettsiales bacterium]
MSDSKKAPAKKSGAKSAPYTAPEGSFWAKAWTLPAALAALGLVLTLVFGLMGNVDRLGYAYLFALMTCLTFVFGGLFLVIAEHLTAGHWGVTTRRIPEIVMSGVPVLFVLAIPLFAGVYTGSFTMYDEWMHVHHSEHAPDGADAPLEEGHEEHEDPEASLFEATVAHAQHGEAEGEGEHEVHHTPQFEELHHHTLEKKSGYLAPTGWGVRALVYFLVWMLLAFFYFRTSRKQDETKDLQLTNKMKKWAPLSAIAFGLTLTFAAFDWMMSLEPTWYSTIFGVVIFAGSAVGILAFTVIIAISLIQRGVVGKAMNVEHVHDLGKLLFGFMCFWAYTSFSQWMLIWYAGIPEEATWFHKRWEGGWQFWSLMLMLGHFALPFYFLISRMVKRRLPLMMMGAIWLLIMHIADIYFYVMPQFGALTLRPVDFGALMFVGGIFFAYVFWQLGRLPLIPLGDPRLQRSLDHHQSH